MTMTTVILTLLAGAAATAVFYNKLKASRPVPVKVQVRRGK